MCWYSSTSTAVARAVKEVMEGAVTACVGCVVLLCAHIYGSVLLSDFAEFVACEGQLWA